MRQQVRKKRLNGPMIILGTVISLALSFSMAGNAMAASSTSATYTTTGSSSTTTNTTKNATGSNTAGSSTGSNTASSTTGSTTGSSSSSTGSYTAVSTGKNKSNTSQMKLILNRGDAEINRRLYTLSGLNTKVESASYLTAADRSTLSGEVLSTISGLDTLETELNSSITLKQAIGYAKQIVTEYRVYALVAPKIYIIKVADYQQAVQGQLTSLHQILETRVNQLSGSQKSVWQADLATMFSDIKNANAISSGIENSVVALTPADYNTDHQILVGDNLKLATAHNDDHAAFVEAKTVIKGLIAGPSQQSN